jgi:diguanylate cyclase (GGDEF)-like protein/PAS domain S-box-containing protein
MTAAWTRARLTALAAGREVYFSSRSATALPVPAWILTAGASAPLATVGQQVAVTHPDDRQTLVDLWWEASNDPGTLVEAEVRARVEDAWVLTRTALVCLFDDPDIGAMVHAVAIGERVEGFDYEEVVQSGEYEETRWLIHTLDESGVILSTEGMVFEITGRHPSEVIGQAVIEHLHPDGFDDALTAWMEIQNGPPGTTRTSRTRVLRPDGTTVWVEGTTIKRVADDGRSMATTIVHDVTDRRRQESALRTSQHEFRLLADQVPAAVFRADAEQCITFRNERWRAELDGDQPVERLVELVHHDDRAAHAGQLARLATGRHDATAAYEVRSRDGGRVWAITCRSVPDLVNDSRSYVGSVTDITATVRLRERAERDALTGLWNRRATEEHLALSLAADGPGTVAVFVDLDGFKDVNDTWGHDAGDAVLRQLALRLAACVRPADVVGRFGGDEFVVVMQGAADQSDAAVAGRIGAALAEPITWAGGGPWAPAASIGIARGEIGDDAASVVRRADLEMFADKRRRKALG